MNLNFTFLFLLCSLFFCREAVGQMVVRGEVIAPDGESLAFVSVIASGESRQVAFTDVEGQFAIPLNNGFQSLSFRYVGFKEKVLMASEIGPNPLKIILQPSDNTLTGVDIVAGENPADIIIRKAIAYRRQNNPEWEGAYRCKTYNKLNFEPMLNRTVYAAKNKSEKSMQGFDQIELNSKTRQLFLMETVTERSFKAPALLQERVLLNRVSGFKNAELIALANAIQPFSFYGDYLPVLDKKFVNPISPGSTQRYFFEMKDTLYNGADTVWVIAFKPRKGKVFTALKGVIHIHSRYYAVQHVMAHPAFGNQNLDMTIEQAYQFVSEGQAGRWFPEQLNFEIKAARYPSPGMGIRARGLSNISEVELGLHLKPHDFNSEQPIYMDKNASTRDSVRWAPWRKNQLLNDKEINTYLFIDSLGKQKNFDRIAKVMGALSTGIWPLNDRVGIQIKSLIRFNNYENTRLGIGFTNAQYRPLGKARRLEWGAAIGYGFKDQRLKENAWLLWRINRPMKTHLRLDVQDDLLEPGTPYELTSTSFFDRTLYAYRMDRVREFSLQGSSRLTAFLSAAITTRHQTITPVGYTYNYRRNENSQGINRFEFREITAFLRLAHGETLRSFLGVASTVQRWPVVELAYTRGTGTASYQRGLATIYQSKFIRRAGYFQWRLEGGMASSDAPLAKLFTLNQIGGGFGLLAVDQTFQALPDTLFLHNKYVSLFLSQEIGPVLYQRKHSSPFLSVLQNASWGAMEKPGLHEGLGFLSMEKPFLESGIRLDNILRYNYLNIGWINLGIAVFYRWGYLHDPVELRNFTPRMSMKFTL